MRGYGVDCESGRVVGIKAAKPPSRNALMLKVGILVILTKKLKNLLH